MPRPTPLTPDEIDRLMADLDAGVYDEELRASRGWLEGAPTVPQLERFSELKEFDVKAWAERKGVKLPER